MSTRELELPESVRHLDGDAVIDALARNNGNISSAARHLNVPSADFRAMLRANPRYQAAAQELIEHRQDLADETILECLQHSDLRYRLPAAMFQSRYSTVAAARGWITNAPVEDDPAPTVPREMIIRWGGPDGAIAAPQPTEQVMRDGKMIELPVYDQGRDETPAVHNNFHVARDVLSLNAPVDGLKDHQVCEAHVDDGLGVEDLKPMSDTLRQDALKRIQDAPRAREAIIEHLRKKHFDVSGL